ncbi:MAG: phosphoribosyltransferase family protein [Nitrososphaerales archaeon]
MMYVRKQGEGRGQDGLLEGISAPGSRVLIIDDLVSTGTSIVSAAGALRKKGYRVTDAAVLVDRLEGGKENLATIGVNLSSYASIKNLLQALRQMKLARKQLGLHETRYRLSRSMSGGIEACLVEPAAPGERCSPWGRASRVRENPFTVVAG